MIKIITYKEFLDFCANRYLDRKWGLPGEIMCCDILSQMIHIEYSKWKFWTWLNTKRKRQELWKELGPAADEYVNKWNEEFNKEG